MLLTIICVIIALIVGALGCLFLLSHITMDPYPHRYQCTFCEVEGVVFKFSTDDIDWFNRAVDDHLKKYHPLQAK